MRSIYLPERPAESYTLGGRLGRHLNHDPRSLRYVLSAAAEVKAVEWERHIPILDQGQLGSCTGNALVGALGSGPMFDALHAAGWFDGARVLDESLAVSIYSDAEVLDGGAGLPSEDQGSSGLSVAQVGKARGLLAGYQHAVDIATAHAAIQAGPFIIGTYWLAAMDVPDPEGIVRAEGAPRGGHEYLCRAYDPARDLWWFDNSWSARYGLRGSFAYDTPALSTLLGRHGDITSLVPVGQPKPEPTPEPEPAPDTLPFAVHEFWVQTRDWSAMPHTKGNGAAARAARRLYVDAGLST